MTSKYKKKHKCPAPDQCPLGPKKQGYPCLFAGQQQRADTGQLVDNCVFSDVVFGINQGMQREARAASGPGIVLPGPGSPLGGKTH